MVGIAKYMYCNLIIAHMVLEVSFCLLVRCIYHIYHKPKCYWCHHPSYHRSAINPIAIHSPFWTSAGPSRHLRHVRLDAAHALCACLQRSHGSSDREIMRLWDYEIFSHNDGGFTSNNEEGSPWKSMKRGDRRMDFFLGISSGNLLHSYW